MDSQTDSVYYHQTQSNSAPTLQGAIRKLEISNFNSVSSKTQSNPAPTFRAVRGLVIGSQLETITDTDQEVPSQPNLNPPTYRAVRNINNVDSSNTTRPVFFQQPPLNTRQADVSVAASPVFENFKKEVESLKVMKRQVQEKFGIARDKGDNLLSGVEEWLNKAGDEISKAEELLKKEATAKKRFFEEFDQLATKMTPSLLEHKESGKDFVTRVSVFKNRDINVAPEKVGDSFFVSAKKKIGYTSNSSENVEKLRHEAEKLKVMRRRVQELIDISISKGELLSYGVEDWVKEVDYEISKVDEFLEEEEEANAKKTWGKIGLCGNRGSLHRYEKSAAKMVPPLVQLQEHGNTYEISGVFIKILPPTNLDFYQTKNLEDLATHNSALDAIIAALEDENKQIIGIFGLGGVGKTTLAMEVAARVVKNTNMFFADVAFAFVSQRVNAVKIQKDLENATKRIMEGEKILIILDDVWEKLNLEELSIPCGSNNMKCKILLTSRDEKVCQDMNAQSIIYVDSLPTQEAWILFRRVVGERVQTHGDLKPIAEEVAKECGGLPLLIQVVGNALKDESIPSWKAAVSQLKKHAAWEINPDIRKAFNQLMLSYDYLKSQEAKVCFLLCGLFHEVEDIELEELVRYVVGLELFGKLESIEIARDRVQKAVNMLTSSCLLLNVEDDKGCTKMHSVVRDLALLIGSKDKNKYLLKAGKDLTEWLPRDNNVKHLADYQTNFDDFLGSYDSMIRMLDKKALLRALSKATNHYHDRYIIKDGETGKVYKGKLLRNGQLMYFAVRRSNRQHGENYIDFDRELKILSNFKHENVSSIFKYFDEDDENIIIYEPTFHGSLQENLSNPALTWSRRLQICLGVARALNYIHNRGLIHCDINSYNILLDEDWNPKIYGFELCTEYPQSWTRRLQLSRYLHTTSVMTPNYDVQLFGELLIEVLCEKKPMLAEGGFNDQVDDNIDSSLRKHIDSQSMNYFKNIAYNCLDKKLVEPPSMKEIVKELEKALELQRQQEDLERSSNGDEGASRDRLQIGNLEISLIAIKDATDQFTKVFIGNGGFGTVYRAELVVLDIQSVSSIIGKSKQELPMKIRKLVAIKRHSKKDEQAQKDFFTEIKLLTSCIHPNVVSLFGYSNEADELILVYEYASNRDLSDYLKTKRSRLTWSQRLQICLQVARGINCVHNNNIIHRDIKSKNILLDENLNAKLADFGLSTLIPTTVGDKSTIRTKKVGGTTVYIDPEYRETGEYKKESDIYSFGVVLFEVLSGKMAYDPTYTRENDDGLAPIVRRRFEAGTLTELIDPKMFQEDDEHTITLNRGPTKDSYDLFSKVGHKCLAKTGAGRPKMEVVIKTLEEALEAQGKSMKLSRFQLSSIEDATHNFDKTYYIGSDTSGKVYKAQLDHFESNSLLAPAGKNNGEPPAKKRINVAIKRISGRVDEHEEGFFSEIEMRTRYKHPNIVPLLGICYEGDKMLLVYEHDKSLDEYLRDTDNMTKHTWIQRLYQCLGIAYGLNHLHTLIDRKQEMIHVDVRSANILVGKSGEAKIAYFGFSKLLPPNQEASSDTTNNDVRTKVYHCPADYQNTGELRKKSDIYSFGVVLFEIFCGRVAYDPDYIAKHDNWLAPVARQSFIDGTIKKMIDPALKEESVEDILTSERESILDSVGTYLRIANQCLAENQAERPTMQLVIEELEKALSIQMKFLEIPLFEIMTATDNFHEECLVGYGGFGAVYRAELEVLDIQSVPSIIGKSKDELPMKTRTVAISRYSKTMHEQTGYDFFTEIKLLSSCKHPNVVSLLGFCIEANEMILVFEYAPKGSLADNLEIRRHSLTWAQRIQICLDVARGINYIHTNNIIHGDIKSDNILLDENLNAKVSDFALATLIPTVGDESTIYTQILAGTATYIDPEYMMTGRLKKESDIYSFGVVLFEVLSGKMAYDGTYMRENDDGLAPIVRRRFNDGTLMGLIDPKMLEDEDDDDDEHIFNRRPTQDSFDLVSQVGYECLAETQAERPNMGVVIKTLEDALEAQSKVDQAVQLSG